MDATDEPRPSKPKHRVLFELGRGGMGTVFLCVTEGPSGFRKLKVVKRLRADLAADPTCLRMFLEEARLAARLAHPNVVQTNEVGFDGTHYFMEMEYLEGRSLEALLRARALQPEGVPLAVVVWLVAQALAGLHYAHELTDLSGAPLGVVHRDVSPHNVFVTYEGSVKVLDFGIAKAADATETRSDGIRGKVAYMAPEQAARGFVDRRADVFAVGIILWQAVTGQRRWNELSEREILAKLVAGDIPQAVPTDPPVPEELARICARALAPRPDDRFPTAEAMAHALEGWLDHSGPRVGPPQLARAMRDLFGRLREQVRQEIQAHVESPPASSAGTRDAVALHPASGTPAPTTVRRPDGRRVDRAGVDGGGRVRARSAALAAAVLAGLAGLVLLVARRPSQRAPGSIVDARPEPACSRSVDCASDAVCRRGQCIALASEDCVVLAEPGHAANDSTIWFGAMLPVSGDDGRLFGRANANAVELARRDFMTMHGGLPAPQAGRPVRPLGVVLCDDANDAPRAARHLVDDVGVPAVIGFRQSLEVTDLAASLFIPQGVLALAALNVSPLVTRVPHPDGSPRLVWRTTVSSAEWATPLARLVSDVFEPELRGSGVLGPADRMSVAVVRISNSSTLGAADALFSTLHFNGRSALANGDDFRQFEWDHAVVDELVRYRPHVVIAFEPQTIEGTLQPLEAAWPPGSRYRPRYAAFGTVGLEAVYDVIGASADLRHRFLAVELPATTLANVEFANRYNLAFKPPVTPGTAPGVAYDALYVLAYAAYAAEAIDHARIDGSSLARAMAHLVPPGVAVDVRPARIGDALDALRAGRNVDLQGAATTLDFDLATGDVHSDFAVYCIESGNSRRPADVVESGMVYRTATGRLEGKLACP
jgi:ABC-type branched-subunit amino acid transport system substrate-binding protein/tRNA A-37 threonylcarbamoyl transferase component Bud32